MIRRRPGATLFLLALCGTAAAQQTTTDDMKKLKEEIEQLRREVADLKRVGLSPKAAETPSEDAELKALREEAATEAQGEKEAPSPGAGTAYPAGASQGITQRLNQFNPRITVFGDFIGRFQLGDNPLEVADEDTGDLTQIDNKFSLREVELDLRTDIDPYAKGVLILAIEKETPGSEYGIDVEEGYATLETLPWNFRAKVGRWREEFGVANNTHRHDLPWFDYPFATLAFLGEEGIIGDGAGLLWLAPGVPLELQANIFTPSGWFITENANEPDYLGRASYFIDITERSWLRFGGSVIYGKTTPGGGRDAILGGPDATFKWVKDQATSFVLTSELYALHRENVVDDGLGGTIEETDNAQGLFVAAQVQPGLYRWYFGARYDWDNYLDEVEGNREWAASAFISYYTTEFLRFRLGYEHRELELGPSGRTNDPYDTLLLQITWVFGSHPAEPYWVNR